MNNAQQFFYKYITTPIARFIDFLNLKKSFKIYKRRQKLAKDNEFAYIEVTSKVLFEQELQEHAAIGEVPNPLFIPLIIQKNIEKATRMFREKKANGDFDELNLMLK